MSSPTLEVGKQLIALVLPVWFCVCCLKDFPFSFAVPNVTKMEQERPYYAVIAGLCASFASLFGKLTANSGRLLEHAGLTAVSTRKEPLLVLALFSHWFKTHKDTLSRENHP